MKQTDTKPWYKQFWPWFLITLPAVVIIACFYTAYLAVHNPLSMVKKDYYQEGLTINKNLDELKNARALGVQAHIHFADKQFIHVELTARQEMVFPEQVQLSFNHPVDDSKDTAIILTRREGNNFSSDSIAAEQWHLLTGEKHWYIQLQAVGATANDWALEGDAGQATISDFMLDANGN